MLAALNFKVLLVAGSNKGVDNLAEAVAEALSKHPQLQRRCGQLVRFQTPAYQLGQIRIDSASSPQFKLGALRNRESASHILEDMQVHNLARDFAKANEESEYRCKEFLKMMATDQAQGLSGEGVKKLRNEYEFCVGKVLENSTIIATTLSNASQDLLRDSEFKPDFVISDDAGQCLEGDHCIALTLTSARAVILIGDPHQLPPTLISENGCNEGAKYLKRSLMTRLYEAGYPCVMLSTNYRNHSQILDLLNRNMYHGQLKVGPINDNPERIGRAWDSFTWSRHWFRNCGVAGFRRLFISTTGHAEQKQNSLSSYNEAQVDVLRHLLEQLYRFETPGGDRIEPKDVMILSPYRDQRALVGKTLGENSIGFNQNLTVDAAQGSKSPVVIFLMTKPSADPNKVGFVGDRHRLNVALSRAQKVLIVIGNLAIWNSIAIRELEIRVGRRNKFLIELLRDVTKKCHTLTWAGQRTVEELDPPAHSQVNYILHDRRIHPPTMSATTHALAATTVGLPPLTVSPSAPRPRVSLPQLSARSQYREAPLTLPPQPGLSAAPRPGEEATDDDVDMEDFTGERVPRDKSEAPGPRRNPRLAVGPYVGRQRSRSPVRWTSFVDHGYRDRHSPPRGHSVSERQASEDELRMLEDERNKKRLEYMQAMEDRLALCHFLLRSGCAEPGRDGDDF